jgi:hypothetical protein
LDRHPRLSCTGLALLLLAAGITLLAVGFTHPLLIMGVGALLVALCGAGLLIWKD